ncbi:G-type lectin S-receptor-like serine/threonine-protein kinase At4g27290 [Salvia miltiorrhiza]|uniref:G-type lectin S-receptor-like serine/threonine-protein kinase At4g27290 n=1 Tax=Salvia miltiorrhiza TaxID=226208 RepID=UPI0025AC7958|nr:G-type lectin S-receptor-like serine/threonine-protein kinase At4g27290 [Salvia miltiorrhiza]
MTFMCLSILVFALPIFLSSLVCNGSDTLLLGQSLLPNQTLVSKGGKFELGYFSPPNSTNFYIGIWYKSIPLQTVVWVFNRYTPILNNSQLKLLYYDKYSSLCLLIAGIDDGEICFGTSSNIREALILDTGNFVMRNASGGILWQSFDEPTDTWLPGMKLTDSDSLYSWRNPNSLYSWRNPNDPSLGNYSLVSDKRQLFIRYNDNLSLWASGNHSNFSSSYNVALESSGTDEHFMYYKNYSDSLVSRIVIDYLGRLTRYGWSEASQAWIVLASTADFMSRPNSICNHSYCRCLDGFVQDGELSSGCERRRPLKCGERKTTFVTLSIARLPAYPQYWTTTTNDLCNLACSRNCSCTAYSYDTIIGGLCFLYMGDLSAMESPLNNSVGVDIYIKTESAYNGKLLVVALVVPIPAAVIISCFCFYYIWPKLKSKVSGERNQNLLLLDWNSNEAAYEGHGSVRKKDSGHELPFFSLESIAKSTNKFSITNKLGQGGFGPVFKGELLNGQFVAVKRLSKRSGQGLEEFRNEMELIAKLQHRNLVRILGCCNEKDEMILVYEYMPNKSLNSFLFEINKKEVLDWKKRVHIISGIAQGLLYLHQYSRLRIVHRDLKASNILLDADMNPKISDFGMARIFGGNDSQANTKRIVGTYGYMSPEYAMEGLFSVKSDVFAFGILMLEIISGKKNTGLLRYAWNLWKSDCVDELIDPILELSNGSSSTAIRYIQISLLCVEENPVDRPLISDIVGMLNNEKRSIESPRNPALTIGRALVKKTPTPHEVKSCSINDMSVSYVEAR